MSARYAMFHCLPWIEHVWCVWCARQAGCFPQGATVLTQPLSWRDSLRSLVFLVLIKYIKQKSAVGRVFKLHHPECKCEPWYRPETSKVTVRVWPPKEEEQGAPEQHRLTHTLTHQQHWLECTQQIFHVSSCIFDPNVFYFGRKLFVPPLAYVQYVLCYSFLQMI